MDKEETVLFYIICLFLIARCKCKLLVVSANTPRIFKQFNLTIRILEVFNEKNVIIMMSKNCIINALDIWILTVVGISVSKTAPERRARAHIAAD